MFNTKHRQLRHLQKQLDQALEKAMFPGASLEEQEEKLASATTSLGVNWRVGKVEYLMYGPSGETQVNFVADNLSYVSTWPIWAFEQAKLSLLYEKRLKVFCVGEPRGPNLLYVFILSESSSST